MILTRGGDRVILGYCPNHNHISWNDCCDNEHLQLALNTSTKQEERGGRFVTCYSYTSLGEYICKSFTD